MLLRALALLGVLVAPLALSACGDSTPSVESGKLSIITTTTQIGSMTESVAGDLASVRSLLTPGADPHSYEPRPSDLAAINRSALILRNGIGLDNWLDKSIQNAGGNHPVITVSDGVPIRKGDEQDPAGDPHVWFSVANAMTMTRNIRDALVKVDPPHADTYRANATAYLAKLSDLDKYIKDQVASLPPENRKIVTNHDAFGYFIERYGLIYVGAIVPSMSTESEPSAQDVAELTAKIKSEKVKAIFLENSINPRLARQIANDAGVKVVDTLYGDTLGEPGTPGATYESMMRYNTDTIVSALR